MALVFRQYQSGVVGITLNYPATSIRPEGIDTAIANTAPTCRTSGLARVEQPQKARIAHITGEVLSRDGKKLAVDASQEAPNG